MRLSKGLEVEVTSDDDGFRGVWYVGKIIQPPKKPDDVYVVVEYNELVYEEDESRKLSERVHVSLVRPLPPAPPEGDDEIEVNDVVDVFHKDGWWVGVVEEVVGKDEFVVWFDDPPDRMSVRRLDVRLHLDWVQDKWEKPEKRNKKQKSGRLAMHSNHSGNSKRQNGSGEKQQPGKSGASTEKKDTCINDEIAEKECNAEEVDMSVKEQKGVSAKYCETPPKKGKNKTVDQAMSLTPEDSSRPAMLSHNFSYSRRQKTRAKKQQAGKSCASTEKKATSLSAEIVEKDHNAEKIDMSVKEVNGVSAKNCKTPPKKDQKNKSRDQEMHTVDDSSRLSMFSNQSGNSKRQSRRISKQLAEKVCGSTEKDSTGVHVDIAEKECITKVVNGALPAKDCETSLKKGQKKQRIEEITTVDSTNGSTQGDVSSKRKRGKQIGKGSAGAIRSLRNRIMEDSSSVEDEAEMNAVGDCQMQTTLNDKSNKNHFQPSSNDSMKVTADKKHTSGIHRHSDCLRETAIAPLPEDQADETVPSKRVKRPKDNLSNEHEGMSKLVDKCQNASEENTSLPELNHAKAVDMLMNGNLGDVSDDQVSNTSLQVDKPSPRGSDASRTLPDQHQCANENGKLDGFGTPPVATQDKIDNTDGPKLSSVPGDSPLKILNLNQADKNSELGTPASVSIHNMENCQSLPFIKCSPLWKAIESLEIYRRMEKKPHFSPLVKYNEETREGLAIAHVVNFSNLVERTTKLQFSDPITVIESSLEALSELESNGFDVETTRACLAQLLSKKQIGEELQKECQDIENEISNGLSEKEKIDEEITQLNQQMNELVAKLGDAVTRKEMKERVISTLKSKQDVVRKYVQGLQLDFQNIVGSLG